MKEREGSQCSDILHLKEMAFILSTALRHNPVVSGSQSFIINLPSLTMEKSVPLGCLIPFSKALGSSGFGLHIPTTVGLNLQDLKIFKLGKLRTKQCGWVCKLSGVGLK